MTTLQHFIYPLVGILVDMAPYILLGFLFAGVLHTFITPAMMQRHLSGSGWGPVVKAALFGVPLPLCSCGVLPTAVALRKQGASAGAATSFLIATPQTGIDSIAATYSLLGGPFAVLRPVAALVGAVAGGYAVDRSCSHDQGAPAAHETAGGGEAAAAGMPLGRRVREALRFGFVDMVRSVGKWLVIGLVIAAAVTVLLPDDILGALNDYPLLAMLAMVAIAIPMYVCATGSIPIALSLMMKGLSPGVAFVLLMAGPAANFASVIILRRSLGTMATAIYIAAVTVTAIAFGLLIHYLLPGSWFIPGAGSATAAAGADCHLHLPLFSTVCAVVLVALLLNAAVRRPAKGGHSCCGGDVAEKPAEGSSCCCGHKAPAAPAGKPVMRGVRIDGGSVRPASGVQGCC
ncbi:MAG: permease, partial [Muribaculaceae bacterium]|nr:permease [Muribaculaceae bacterium]